MFDQIVQFLAGLIPRLYSLGLRIGHDDLTPWLIQALNLSIVTTLLFAEDLCNKSTRWALGVAMAMMISVLHESVLEGTALGPWHRRAMTMLVALPLAYALVMRSPNCT